MSISAIAALHKSQPYLSGIHIHDAEIERISIERREKEMAGQARKLARSTGGCYLCPGQCGRIISANKDFCLSCTEKGMKYMKHIVKLECGHQVVAEFVVTPQTEHRQVYPCSDCHSMSVIMSAEPIPEQVIEAAPVSDGADPAPVPVPVPDPVTEPAVSDPSNATDPAGDSK